MKEREVEEWAQRFQDMKSNHQQLRQKLDSLERYLSDLPTPDESNHNRQEISFYKDIRKCRSLKDLSYPSSVSGTVLYLGI